MLKYSSVLTEWSKLDRKLMHAVNKGNTEEVFNLVSRKGVNPAKVHPKKGFTSLHLAAAKGLTDIMAIFVKVEIDIDTRDIRGQTALHCSLRQARYEAARLLLAHEASVLIVDHEYQSVLHHACNGGHLGCIQLLLHHHAPVYLRDKHGRCPLAYAAWLGQASVCRLLLENGADVDSAGTNRITPLMLAASNGCSAVCDYLLRRGANVQLTDCEGHDARWYSQTHRHADVTKILEQALVRQLINIGDSGIIIGETIDASPKISIVITEPSVTDRKNGSDEAEQSRFDRSRYFIEFSKANVSPASSPSQTVGKLPKSILKTRSRSVDDLDNSRGSPVGKDDRDVTRNVSNSSDDISDRLITDVTVGVKGRGGLDDITTNDIVQVEQSNAGKEGVATQAWQRVTGNTKDVVDTRDIKSTEDARNTEEHEAIKNIKTTEGITDSTEDTEDIRDFRNTDGIKTTEELRDGVDVEANKPIENITSCREIEMSDTGGDTEYVEESTPVRDLKRFPVQVIRDRMLVLQKKHIDVLVELEELHETTKEIEYGNTCRRRSCILTFVRYTWIYDQLQQLRMSFEDISRKIASASSDFENKSELSELVEHYVGIKDVPEARKDLRGGEILELDSDGDAKNNEDFSERLCRIVSKSRELSCEIEEVTRKITDVLEYQLFACKESQDVKEGSSEVKERTSRTASSERVVLGGTSQLVSDSEESGLMGSGISKQYQSNHEPNIVNKEAAEMKSSGEEFVEPTGMPICADIEEQVNEMGVTKLHWLRSRLERMLKWNKEMNIVVSELRRTLDAKEFEIRELQERITILRQQLSSDGEDYQNTLEIIRSDNLWQCRMVEEENKRLRLLARYLTETLQSRQELERSLIDSEHGSEDPVGALTGVAQIDMRGSSDNNEPNTNGDVLGRIPRGQSVDLSADSSWVAYQTGRLFEKNNDLLEDVVGLRCELRNSRNVCMDLEERNRQLQQMVEELIMENYGLKITIEEQGFYLQNAMLQHIEACRLQSQATRAFVSNLDLSDNFTSGDDMAECESNVDNHSETARESGLCATERDTVNRPGDLDKPWLLKTFRTASNITESKIRLMDRSSISEVPDDHEIHLHGTEVEPRSDLQHELKSSLVEPGFSTEFQTEDVEATSNIEEKHPRNPGENFSVEHSGGVSIVDWHLTGRDMDSAKRVHEELTFTLDRQMPGHEIDLHKSKPLHREGETVVVKQLNGHAINSASPLHDIDKLRNKLQQTISENETIINRNEELEIRCRSLEQLNLGLKAKCNDLMDRNMDLQSLETQYHEEKRLNADLNRTVESLWRENEKLSHEVERLVFICEIKKIKNLPDSSRSKVAPISEFTISSPDGETVLNGQQYDVNGVPRSEGTDLNLFSIDDTIKIGAVGPQVGFQKLAIQRARVCDVESQTDSNEDYLMGLHIQDSDYFSRIDGEVRMLKKVNRDLTVQIADLQYQLSRQWLPDEDKVQRCAEENLQHLSVMAEFESKCDEIEKSTSINANRTPLISPEDQNLVMQMRLENSKLREFVSTLEVQVEKQLSQSSSLVTSPRCLSPSATSPTGEEQRSTVQDRHAKDHEATETDQSDPYATIEQLRQQIKDDEKKYSEIIRNYRRHLLSSIQGKLDPTVKQALFNIVETRQPPTQHTDPSVGEF